MNRKIGLLAMFSPLLFAAVYLTMSSVRREYSHLTKAISELGSLDAPRAWVWNVFGYIIPGLLVALLGLGIRNRFATARGALLPAVALVASGLLMTLAQSRSVTSAEETGKNRRCCQNQRRPDERAPLASLAHNSRERECGD
jgi:hypothetical protein